MVADDIVAKTRWFVLLVALGVGCRLRGVDGLRIAFEVGVDDERGTQLAIFVFEENAGVVPARHLDALCTVWLTVWYVIGQEVSPVEHVQAVVAWEAL